MKKVGYVRKVDEKGRIWLPSEVREFGISHGDKFEVYTSNDKNTIILKKRIEKCTNCNRTGGLIRFGKLVICRECLNKMYLEAIK